MICIPGAHDLGNDAMHKDSKMQLGVPTAASWGADMAEYAITCLDKDVRVLWGGPRFRKLLPYSA